MARPTSPRHSIRGIDMMRALALIFLMILAAQPAAAGVVVSADVSDVAVTIYRDPGRGKGAMDANWPGGFALITETRTITVPAGDSVIRFEGVAEGMLPETAIITGLPKAVREKNRDARLISPAGLVDAYLKRAVHLTRTNRKTGKVIEQDAVIQAGPNGGVILQTKDGVEALGCSGLPERMLYDRIPEDLSAKPTLSVQANSDQAVTATVTLTYMAQGFDWSAHYVARVDETGKKLGLFAWLTVANGGAQSFKNAQMQVVAGQPNKESNAAPLYRPSPSLVLRCWPMDVTSTHPRYVFARLPWAQYQPEFESDSGGADIVVTSRRMKRMESLAEAPAPVSALSADVIAKQEDLGDLKLYRVPSRVTVAAQSQKQVAMIDQPEAFFDRIYSANVSDGDDEPHPMPLLLRSKNVKDKGLGLPLPAGGIALFEPVNDQSLLVGEDDMADKAIGEDVEIRVGESPDVQWTLKRLSEKSKTQTWRATITNARPFPIKAELLVPYDLENRPKGLERGRGGWKLPVDIAANETGTIDYTIKLDRRR